MGKSRQAQFLTMAISILPCYDWLCHSVDLINAALFLGFSIIKGVPSWSLGEKWTKERWEKGHKGTNEESHMQNFENMSRRVQL